VRRLRTLRDFVSWENRHGYRGAQDQGIRPDGRESMKKALGEPCVSVVNETTQTGAPCYEAKWLT